MRWDITPHIASMAKNERGSSVVEFAIILPVAVIFICGVLSYAIYFGAAHSVQQLAADAARASVAGLSDTERASLARAQVAASGGSYPLLQVAKVSVDAAPLPSDSTQFVVRVVFNSEDLPIWAFAGLIPLPGKLISRTAVIKRGGY